jgi:hypothetical protein
MPVGGGKGPNSGPGTTTGQTAPGATGSGGLSGGTGTGSPSGPSAIGSLALAGSASDGTGAQAGSVSGVSWGSVHGGCGVFNGTSSDVTTSGPVLNTAAGSSFTVSAWVYLTKDNGFATAVSQDGSVNSGFYLQYSLADNRWSFARVKGDSTADDTGVRALSTAPPALDTWTHLVGVYEGSSGQLRLYVNGTPAGTGTDATPYAANGDLAIGRAQFGGKPVDWFPGDISDVAVFDQALTASQIQAL